MIKIMSKKEIINYIPEENEILLRVSSSLPYGKENGFNKIFSFGFEDLDYECSYSISNEDVDAILKIFLEYSLENFVFQCDYAQGRFPALALAYSIIIHKNDKLNIIDNYPDMNNYVFGKILNRYNELIEIHKNNVAILNYLKEKEY